MRSKVKIIAAALLATGFGATALFAQEPPAETRSAEPAASEQPAHGGMGMMNGEMGMMMNMMDEEMRAQMMRMMENCNRMMEQSLQEAPASEG